MEKERLEHWYRNGIVAKYLKKNARSKKKFSFLDGPITANNPMGVHHGRGRTYKDLWQRYFTIRGYKQRYQNGFDCQGLWVEVEVEKELGFKSKKDIVAYGIEQFVEKCKERVKKFSAIQTEQSKRLGMFMDWGNDYYTMSDENNYAIWNFLKVCHDRGWIYKGHESVPWCPRCETAISQHEMLTEDYKEVTHKAIYLELPVVGVRTTAVSRVGRQSQATFQAQPQSGLNEAPTRNHSENEQVYPDGASVPSKQDYSAAEQNAPESLLVWTTTPWTLPANIAVAVDPELEYALVEGYTGDRYWVAKEAVERVFGSDAAPKESSFAPEASSLAPAKSDPSARPPALERSDSGQGFGRDSGFSVDNPFPSVQASRHKVVRVAKGIELVGLKYRGPFDDFPAVKAVTDEFPDKFHTVVAADPLIMPITTTEGTGLIHTAVSAGTEDFKLGQKLGLPMIPVIADDATYMKGFGDLTGKNAKEHPELIFDALKKKEESGEDWIFDIHDYTHRYPACWRCKTELVWKVTDEWYVAMDRPWPISNLKSQISKRSDKKKISINKTLRQQMIEVAKKINWIPEFGLERELDWLTNMHDWLISKKNRYWGLALPIWECATCGWFDVVGSKSELRKRASEGWSAFDGHTPHKPWIDAVKIACPVCKKPVSRVEPVGNPWLDAGIVPFSTLPKGWFPADFITEAFPGQFKNWFYSMIVMSTVLAKTNPFKTVLGYETVVGEDGRPMHKSWGNAIEFNEGAEKIGVDVMRWMYAKTAPTAQLLFGYKTAEDIRRRFFLILWNSFRFFIEMAKADGYELRTTNYGLRTGNILDRWILARLKETVRVVERALDRYQSVPATDALESFVTDFSTWYIRRSRDRVGPAAISKIRMQAGKPADANTKTQMQMEESADANTKTQMQMGKFADANTKTQMQAGKSTDTEQAYQTMHVVFLTLSKLLAPVTPYFSDVIYTTITGEASVHLSEWPKLPALTVRDRALLRAMEVGRKIVEGLHAIRKSHGVPLRQPLDAWAVNMKDRSALRSFPDVVGLIETECNVKRLTIDEQFDVLVHTPGTGSTTVTSKEFGEIGLYLDLRINDDLREEGRAREIVRTIQQLRKSEGMGLSDHIVASLPDWPVTFEDEIKRRVLADRLEMSDRASIRRV